MRLTIAYSKIKKRNLVLIDNATYQRETLSEPRSERPIRQPLKKTDCYIKGCRYTDVGRLIGPVSDKLIVQDRL